MTAGPGPPCMHIEPFAPQGSLNLSTNRFLKMAYRQPSASMGHDKPILIVVMVRIEPL